MMPQPTTASQPTSIFNSAQKKKKKIIKKIPAKPPSVTPQVLFLQRVGSSGSTQRQAAAVISSRATRCHCNAGHCCHAAAVPDEDCSLGLFLVVLVPLAACVLLLEQKMVCLS